MFSKYALIVFAFFINSVIPCVLIEDNDLYFVKGEPILLGLCEQDLYVLLCAFSNPVLALYQILMVFIISAPRPSRGPGHF